MAMNGHDPSCNSAFGRKDLNCTRCVALANGAAPVQWAGSKHSARMKAYEQQTLRAIAAHDFKACAAKNIVCTHFDY